MGIDKADSGNRELSNNGRLLEDAALEETRLQIGDDGNFEGCARKLQKAPELAGV